METKTNSQALSVGVIGADGMGTCHALNLHGAVGNARVAAVYDLDQDRARQVARMCGQALVFNDPERLINDPQVDAVVIVSPDHIQAMLTLACLGAGKPVLSEKPLTTTADTALVLSEARRAPPSLKDWLGRFQNAYIRETVEWVESIQEGRPFRGSNT